MLRGHISIRYFSMGENHDGQKMMKSHLSFIKSWTIFLLMFTFTI